MRQKIEISFRPQSGTTMLQYIKNDKGEFVCPQCNIVKKRQNSMHYHMKKHLEELDHVCKVCKKGFLQKQTLDLHVRSKHPELEKEEANRFGCPFEDCAFSALTKGNCIIHCLRVHYQEELKEKMQQDPETKVITCTDCDTEFSSSCGFYYHCKKCMDVANDNTFEAIRYLMA